MKDSPLKCMILVIVTLMIFGFFESSVHATEAENRKAHNKEIFSSLNQGYIDITVEEAWDFLSDTSNGIQVPIDVRTLLEWKNEHIHTPPPENPKHHCLDDLEDEEKLQEFMDLYKGEELIIYCHSGGRSVNAANILVENSFSGTIYNMLGGIITWKAEGFPTIINQPPDVTLINPKEGFFHFSGIPILPTPFDLIADTLALGGFRLRPVIINATDDFDNREDLVVKIYLNGELKGEASYCCDWKLHEWFWTGLAIGNYKLKVTAEDLERNNNSVEIDVSNFCFIP